MITRIVHTKIWTDGFFSELTPTEKAIFIYYITNPDVNIIHCYECPDRKVMFDTGCTSEQLSKAKDKFQSAGKLSFYKEYIKLENASKYESYNGEKNEKAKLKLLSQLSRDVLDWYNKKKDTPINTGIDTSSIPSINHKSEIINNRKRESAEREKPESSISYLENIPDTDFKQFLQDYQITAKDILKKKDELLFYCKRNGKTYKDYKAFLQGALLRDFGKRRAPTIIPAYLNTPNLPEPKELASPQAIQKFREAARKLSIAKSI